jgi:hypothetical protein
MCGARLCKVVLVTAALAASSDFAACGGTTTLPTGTALSALSGTFGFEAHATLGQVFRFGLYIFETPKGGSRSRIYVRDLTLLNVPKGLAIDGVWGERFSRAAPATGVLPVADTSSDVKYGYPVSAIVLDPTCPAEAHCAPTVFGANVRTQDWILVVDAHLTKPGAFKTTGFRVVYDVDGQRYQQTIPGIMGMAPWGVSF